MMISCILVYGAIIVFAIINSAIIVFVYAYVKMLLFNLRIRLVKGLTKVIISYYYLGLTMLTLVFSNSCNARRLSGTRTVKVICQRMSKNSFVHKI